MKTINSFKGDNAFLSNFHPCHVVYEGMVFPSVEHAYQAAKTDDLVLREQVQQSPTAGKAKALGRKLVIRQNWNKIKIAVMYKMLQQKFHAFECGNLLLNTCNDELVEGNTWGDTFWGMVQDDTGAWTGENHLGKLLMRVRYELQQEQDE